MYVAECLLQECRAQSVSIAPSQTSLAVVPVVAEAMSALSTLNFGELYKSLATSAGGSCT